MKAITTAILALSVLLSARQAHATYTDYLYQSGASVVSYGSGSLDTADLTSSQSFDTFGDIAPYSGLLVNAARSQIIMGYSGITGPSAFGAGGGYAASSSVGDAVAISGAFNTVYAPRDYTSRSLLQSQMTFDNTTLASLGVTFGTYTWTWGTGADADSFILHIGQDPIPVPEPATLALLATACATLLAVRRRR